MFYFVSFNASNEEKKHLQRDILVAKGRSILDRDRYTGEHIGLKKVVQAFGGATARTLFLADDKLENEEEVFQILGEKEKELGIFAK